MEIEQTQDKHEIYPLPEGLDAIIIPDGTKYDKELFVISPNYKVTIPFII